jgi:hypothetical protein
MSKDDFKIVVNSQSACSGTNTNNLNYWFDFTSVGVQGYYKLTFSFITTGTGLDLDDPLSAELKIDFNSSCNYTTLSTSISAQTTTHIGFLYNNIFSTTDGFLQADIHSNPPTILQKPMNQSQFNVQIRSPDGSPFLDNIGVAIQNYYLVLNFEKL